MKKIFTLAAALLASFSLWAAYPTATTTYALEDLTVTEATLTYEKTGLSGDAQKLNKVLYIQVEVPCASANGNLYLRGTASNAGRFATIWGSNGTARDEARKVAMKNGNSDAIAFTSADIAEVNGKYYIRFSSADNSGSYFDYKISGFSYVLAEECVTKEVDHIDTALVGAAINGEALSDTDLGLLLESRTNTVYIPSAYVSAPTVTFVEQTSTYYVGETDPKVATKNIDVVATVANDVWQAQATIGGNTYTVQMAKAASVTVTYMDGETTLGTETIAQGGKVAENAKYETKAGCTFAGWYTDAALTTAADLTAAVNADMTLYGKFEKKYINHSIFIDQLVLDYGTKYDIKADLTKYGWEYANLNALDSLNDLENKPNRNADFLGLKMKTAGAYIAGWLAAGDGIVIRFGNIGSDIKVSAKGATTDTEMTITAADLKDPEFYDSEFPIYGFTEDVYVTISTVDGGTVVLKQIIKIEDEFIDVVLPAPGAYMVNVAEAENGTVTANWENKKYRAPVGATVTLTVTPAEGYKIATVTLDSEALTAVEGVYSFVMPAKEVNVAATFVAEGGETAITNTEAAVKAVKVIREGKLFIEKNGVLYNAQGSVVK